MPPFECFEKQNSLLLFTETTEFLRERQYGGTTRWCIQHYLPSNFDVAALVLKTGDGVGVTFGAVAKFRIDESRMQLREIKLSDRRFVDRQLQAP